MLIIFQPNTPKPSLHASSNINHASRHQRHRRRRRLVAGAEAEAEGGAEGEGEEAVAMAVRNFLLHTTIAFRAILLPSGAGSSCDTTSAALSCCHGAPQARAGPQRIRNVMIVTLQALALCSHVNH